MQILPFLSPHHEWKKNVLLRSCVYVTELTVYIFRTWYITYKNNRDACLLFFPVVQLLSTAHIKEDAQMISLLDFVQKIQETKIINHALYTVYEKYNLFFNSINNRKKINLKLNVKLINVFHVG